MSPSPLSNLINVADMVLCKLAVLLTAVFAVSLAADIPSVVLKNAARPGMEMPVPGIGTWGYVHTPGTGVPGEVWNDTVAEIATGQWLSMGGRRIDGSRGYGDQVGVGKAVKASKIPRSEIFMTSKIGLYGYNETFDRMKEVLSDLQLDYVDLLLIHWPRAPSDSSDPACKGDRQTYRECRQSVWKAMEEIYKSGKAHAIGVSNFERNHLEDILVMNSMVPSVNQVEYQPYWHEDDLVAFCKSHDIVYNSYSPLGAPDWAPDRHNWNGTILQLPLIAKIAKAHNVTAAQVMLGWQWQQGIVVNPRTLNVDHMKENLNFFNFELGVDEMKQLSSIKPPEDPKVCPDPHNDK